jgi:hypothetical protein
MGGHLTAAHFSIPGGRGLHVCNSGAAGGQALRREIPYPYRRFRGMSKRKTPLSDILRADVSFKRLALPPISGTFKDTRFLIGDNHRHRRGHRLDQLSQRLTIFVWIGILRAVCDSVGDRIPLCILGRRRAAGITPHTPTAAEHATG